MKNMVLIGMPGAGKSTIGVVLAKTLGFTFIDSDLVIQKRENRLLQEIIDDIGMERFLDVEKEAVLSIDVSKSIIATGGSVIFRNETMKHLKKLGDIIYLKVSYEEIERRVNNITTRGIAMAKGHTLKDVYDQRVELYEKYANIVIDCDDKNLEEIVKDIKDSIPE
ncbi:shikimate kinase [Vallitalea guaymasensis]|uniref:Shikimate kinase n=1 Tax=Vallitalea guaymasensis TaxID=1185412 RepID=A0A8J8MAE3_9FIRM|nr:shikimate kinase [Vallitalea guaymasensis]QUH29286.1 shikimate kinase [Vallitalea guaymasensis]